MLPNQSATVRLALRVLSDSAEPLSGRAIATHLGVSPSTANSALRVLEEIGAAKILIKGRANLWSATEDTASIARIQLQSLEPDRRTVVVATALPSELAAVRKKLLDPKIVRSRTGVRFVDGTVVGHSVNWRVLVAQIGMGNNATAAFMAQAIAEFDANLGAFVGVGAGLKPRDQELGDVVVGTRAYNVLAGKEDKDVDGGEVFLGRPASWPISSTLLQLSLATITASEWDPANERRAEAPKAFLGAIASVESVQASANSTVMTRVREHFNDCYVLDMESYGLFQAAVDHNISALSIRGISDFVTDKRAESDKTTQIVAAVNASALFVEILRNADPKDVPILRPTWHAPAAPNNTGSAAGELPHFLGTWIDRFRRDAPLAAEEALTYFVERNLIPLSATALSRILHRPPNWLRSDETGAGWAFVANLALSADLEKSHLAFGQAAERADRVGDTEMAFVFRLSKIQAAADQSSPGEFSNALEDIRLGAPTGGSAILDFFQGAAALPTNLLDLGLKALGATGVAAERLAPLSIPSGEQLNLDAEVRESLAVSILLSLARWYLVRADGDESLKFARIVKRLAPWSTGADLTIAQARLTRILSSKLISGAIENTSAELREIETLALEVRARRLEWGGPTFEPLALAARARAQDGDPVGALRMVRSAPDGTATVHEAKSQAVLRVAAMAAGLARDHKLMLEFAEAIGDDHEALMLKGSAYASIPGKERDAEAAYRSLLRQPDELGEMGFRVLLGLAHLGKLTDAEDGDRVAREMGLLRAQDDSIVDTLLAIDALESGKPDLALELARRHRDNAASVEIEVSALVRLGRPGDGARRLDELGNSRGDHFLRLQAVSLAIRAQQDELALTIANELLIDGSDVIKFEAHLAKLDIARRALDWRELERQASYLRSHRGDRGDRKISDTDLRWVLIEALYNQRKFGVAVAEITGDTQLPFADRSQVQLFIAIARGLSVDSGVVPVEVFELLLSLAAAWVDDEQVAADAIAAITMLKVESQPSPEHMTLIQEFHENYFSRYENSAAFKRLRGDEGDLSELVAHLREQFEPREAASSELATNVWLGTLPLAILAEFSGRPYAEVLIKRSFGVYVVSDGSGVIDAAERAAAARALDTGSVVVDASALIISPKLVLGRSKVTALFEQVFIASGTRTDIELARTSLSMKSTAMLGWDSREGRPTLSEFDQESVDRWDIESRELQTELRTLTVANDPSSATSRWDLSVALAIQLGHALWADDLALRVLAKELGAESFGTLALIEELRTRGRDAFGSESEILSRAKDARIVDLALGRDWLDEARIENWDPNGYLALHIGRPAAWRDTSEAFNQFQKLILGRPKGMSSESLAVWTSRAGSGLAWASPISARPQTVGNLFAWTALRTDPALDIVRLVTGAEQVGENRTLPELTRAAVDLQISLFADGSVINTLVEVLRGALLNVFDASSTAQIIAKSLTGLEPDHKTQAMAALLSAPYGNS